MVRSTPKKTVTTANPYEKIKFSYAGTPLNKKNGKSNKIQSVQTAVDGVFISWSTRPDNKCSFLWPLKQYFTDNGENQGLTKKWNLAGFMVRRLFNEDDITQNKRLPGVPGDDDSYPWDALVTINPDPKATAETVGTDIAVAFSSFSAARKDLFNGKKVDFVFSGVPPESEDNHPLTRYLIDEDCVKVFMLMCFSPKSGNKKEDLLSCHPLMEAFFGSVEVGHKLLDLYAGW